jgi:hypothetical protein
MIYAAVNHAGYDVRLTKRKHLINELDVVPDQPVEKNLGEAFRVHHCLAWIFKQLMSEGYMPDNHEISVSVSDGLKAFLSGQKIPKTKAGSDLVSKSRMILTRFKTSKIN